MFLLSSHIQRCKARLHATIWQKNNTSAIITHTHTHEHVHSYTVLTAIFQINPGSVPPSFSVPTDPYPEDPHGTGQNSPYVLYQSVLCFVNWQTCDCALMRASCCTRSVTMSSWPASDAMCRAVLPFCWYKHIQNTANSVNTCATPIYSNLPGSLS